MQGPPGYVEPGEPLSRSAVELLRSTSESAGSKQSTVTPRQPGLEGTEQILMSEKRLHTASL